MHNHHLVGTTPYLDKLKARINASKLAKRLHDHALGKLEMSPTQIQAAQTLLRKVVPDLSSTEVVAQVTHFSDALSRIAQEREREDAALHTVDNPPIEQSEGNVIH